MKISIEVLFGKDFAAFVRQHAPKISIVDLDADEMKLINAIVNAGWQNVKFRGGLDGHSYTIKIYGEQFRKFKCWCVIPKEWSELIPLVDRLIEIAKPDPLSCYAVQGTY